MEELRVGIVGSRRRDTLHDRGIVFDLITRLTNENIGKKIVLVSGACPQGADHFAKQYWQLFGDRLLEIKEYPPKKWPGMTRWEFTQEAFSRNKLIAEDSHIGYALVAPDRTGGTENTVGHYLSMGKRVFLVDGNGRTYLEEDGTKDTDEVRTTPT